MTIMFLFVGCLACVGFWERCRPCRRSQLPTARRRVANVGLWLFNLVATALIFADPDELREPWALPDWLSLPMGFLFLDLMVYAVHRAQHAMPWLWRLHALHHSDPDVDVTTAVRHHPFEFLIASGIFWFAILVIGVPALAVATHAGTTFALAAATHGNVRWPAWTERLLRPVVITLDLHLVHHSVNLAESNSNFGAVLSVWDRAFGTFAPARPISAFGVAALDPASACRPLAMLATPFQSKLGALVR